mmetsp:Transcript_3029/g.4105  ORF Transcript_3029/g.4105 Transcript_3029/m.4105 type:complete len:99 (-) Transcript_3029:623-919(-)
MLSLFLSLHFDFELLLLLVFAQVALEQLLASLFVLSLQNGIFHANRLEMLLFHHCLSPHRRLTLTLPIAFNTFPVAGDWRARLLLLLWDLFFLRTSQF